jgi:hypothetical protein
MGVLWVYRKALGLHQLSQGSSTHSHDIEGGGTQAVMYMLEAVQHSMTLPWWATIVACTLGMRILLLPTIIYMTRSTAKLKIVKPQIEALTEKYKRMMDGTGGDITKGQQVTRLSSHLGSGLGAEVSCRGGHGTHYSMLQVMVDLGELSPLTHTNQHGGHRQC